MQLEAGAQSEHNNGSPFPAMAEDLPDLPARTWFEYGAREGIPRLLDLWDRHHIKVTSHMVGRAVEANPQLARDIVGQGHEAAAHGYEWVPHWTMSAEAERASYVANIAAIETPDAETVVLRLKAPSSLFLSYMASGGAAIFDPKSADNNKTNPVGTGPFSFVRWNRGDRLEFARNDAYWGEKPALAKATFRFLSDPQAQVAALRARFGNGMADSTEDPDFQRAIAEVMSYKVVPFRNNNANSFRTGIINL